MKSVFTLEEPYPWKGAILFLKGSCAAQNPLQKRIPSMIHFPVPAFCEGAPRTHEHLGILHGLPGPTPLLH